MAGFAAALILSVAACSPALGVERPRPGASDSAYTLALNGGRGPNVIRIDYVGSQFRIRANGTLAPARTCVNPPDNPTELDCPAADINGFQVMARGGNDTIRVGRSVRVPTILNGGPGLDDLVGGATTDRIFGGTGDDRLIGRRGPDQLLGGPGNDTLLGGAGKDVLRGGPGLDILWGGPQRDVETQ